MNVSGPGNACRHRVLNPSAATIVAITAAALLFGTRKLHDRQIVKTIDFLRQSAYGALDANDYARAQVELNLYLAFRSTDLDAREKLSSILSTHIRTRSALEQAFHLNEDLLRNDLPQKELRLQQARIAVQLGRYSDAAAHLRILQALPEESAEIWHLSAYCAKEARRTDDAARCYQRVLTCPNPPERAFEELAELATANPQLMLDPETIRNQMVVTCNSAEAWRLRAMPLVETNEFSAALPYVWQGLALSPDDVALNAILVHCLQLADASRNRHRSDDPQQASPSETDLPQAIHHLQGCIERNPQEAACRIHLAALLWQNQQQTEAIQVLEAGVSRTPQAFQLHGVLIEYMLMLDQIDKAERLLESLPGNALPEAERELLFGQVCLLRNDWKVADSFLQRAITFSEPGSRLHQRAQMLSAACRSGSGITATAVDANLAVPTGNSESVTGWPGLAALRNTPDEKDHAIAESRKMPDVPGGPASLADSLIQRNLEQPVHQRNWNEVAELVRDRDPPITDLTQRNLLRADMLMASGRITEAIASLERASVTDPENPAFQRALARMNGDLNGGLRDRLEKLSGDAPDNHDVLAALIRMHLGGNRVESALDILESIANGQRNPKMNSAESISLAVLTAERVIALEMHLGRTQYTKLFQDAARRYAYELTSINFGAEATLARVLARQDRASEALERLQSLDSRTVSSSKADGIMALVQYASPRKSILQDAMRELVAMINATPDCVSLRISYADAMMYDDHLETAARVLEQIQDAPPDDGEVAARQAWILAVKSGAAGKAEELIAHAIQRQPGNPGFRVIHARVLLAAGKYDDALSRLGATDEAHLTTAALTYKAAALLEIEDMGEARRLVDLIRLQHDQNPMFPADEQLLQAVFQRLHQATTAVRVQP